MDRSLEKEKQASTELNWIMSVRKIPHKKGFFIPVFEWSFGYKNGIRGGELRAWPLHGNLVFKARRESLDHKFESIEGALEKVDEYDWGKPPHIDEVFQDLLEIKERLPIKSLEEANQILEELKKKWEALIVS